MDGVICDFNTKFSEIRQDYPNLEDSKFFELAILKHNIFSTLKPLPDALELLEYVACLKHVYVEMLTSVGTFDEKLGYAVKIQKSGWLERNNIPHKPNFSRSMQEKAEYANAYSILVDDSIGCIEPFQEAGGHGVLHVNAKQTIKEIDDTFKKMKEIEAYRS